MQVSSVEILEKIGFDRAISLESKSQTPDSKNLLVLNEIKSKSLGIDSIYFNTDDSGNSFPAVFLKKVSSFDENTF
ncbi:MAG: hypothetical protein Kapaf2KO_20750 [Candidatus Kapaibacteriales bacterium]